MNRSQKEQEVASLNQRLQEAEIVIVTQQSGLTAADVYDLRQKVRQASANYKVAKNRLAHLALKGTDYEGLADLLSGPTALTSAQDPVAAAKVIADFANGNEKLQIIGGSMKGSALTAANVVALSKLPSLDGLRAKLIGLISAPAQKLASVTQAPAAQLARVFGAYGSSGGANS